MIIKLLLVLSSISAFASSPKLQDVKTSKVGDSFVSELHFDQNVDGSKVTVDYINETIQVNVPQVAIDKRVSQEVKDDKVRLIYVYKPRKKDLRFRIIHKDGVKADQFKNVTDVKAVKNILQIRVNRAPKALAAATVRPRSISDDVKPEKAKEDQDLEEAVKWLSNSETLKKANIKKAKPKVAQKKVEKTEVAKNEAENKDLKESEIPVLTNVKSEKKAKSGNLWMRMVASLGIVIMIILGGVLVYRKAFKSSKIKNKNQRIKILTQHYLGPRKSLAIIRVAGESMLIGVTDNNINLIKPLALIDEELEVDGANSFSESLESANSNITEDEHEEESEDDFAMTRIKDFVSDRLKGMKEL